MEACRSTIQMDVENVGPAEPALVIYESNTGKADELAQELTRRGVQARAAASLVIVKGEANEDTPGKHLGVAEDQRALRAANTAAHD